MSDKKPQDYWNAVAAEKHFTTEFPESLLESFVPKEAAILDVGCGYGRTLGMLKRRGYRNLQGVDFSEKMVARGRKELPEIPFQTADGERLPFDVDSFDGVILFAVLTCIVEDSRQERLIAEVRRVLRPGGVLLVNDFLLNDDPRNRKRYQAAEKYGTYGVFELPEGVTLRHHDREHLRELLSPFVERLFLPVVFATMNGHESRGFCYVGEKR
ncbi:MAG: class I SAM-dependent methyltransferase [Planctomycetia bacterium]|nr:class I SAM-dependent methyltransferase [Planctomycetia bacterium]